MSVVRSKGGVHVFMGGALASYVLSGDAAQWKKGVVTTLSLILVGVLGMSMGLGAMNGAIKASLREARTTVASP